MFLLFRVFNQEAHAQLIGFFAEKPTLEFVERVIDPEPLKGTYYSIMPIQRAVQMVIDMRHPNLFELPSCIHCRLLTKFCVCEIKVSEVVYGESTGRTCDSVGVILPADMGHSKCKKYPLRYWVNRYCLECGYTWCAMSGKCSGIEGFRDMFDWGGPVYWSLSGDHKMTHRLAV